MTLIQLIESASEMLRNGNSIDHIELEFARHGVDIAVVQEIIHTLNPDGSYRRIAV